MKHLSTLLATAGLMLAGYAAQVTAADGTVHLHATVTDTTCSVTNTTRDQIIDLGTISSVGFTGIGSETDRVPFSISLTDCPDSITSVGFTTVGAVSGSADANDNTVYALDNTSTAQGVGVALYDSASGGKKIAPGTAAVATYPLSAGEGTIDLSASVSQTTETVTAGDFTAVTGFSIVYN